MSADLSALTDEQLVHKELQLERDMIELRFRHRDNNNQLGQDCPTLIATPCGLSTTVLRSGDLIGGFM